ncbi:DNA polymerase III subunit gamma and tau [Rothia sp. ZJ1223]|uniref:DNA polymerase III subunit gamma and tau n=1 Tax=Rothia sp. ZJ1223 TaxID=2811098 RepID=UPI00195DA5D0|nr:DNA polymerase III subunit gamma and tau [Rothia sp. ZJ1223]
MSTALYRRYRPETFADVIGQEHVTTPLITALEKNRVNHAYLFSGPRGCGKTTSARILARCLNCAEGPTPAPCGACDSCRELSRDGGGSLDVIEMDAASHGGVDHARDLRERASFAPVRDRYKIFIIDEAHMVTREGFNALLKIVEEPPAHIKFIFATTEPNKVLGTIRSRTHHYPFRLVPPETLTAYLGQLAQEEGVQIAEGVLPLVVRAGGGSVRDSLSILDQLIAGATDEGVTYDLAVALLGFTHGELLDTVVGAFAAQNAGDVFASVDRVIQTGQDPRRFIEDLLERLRDLIIVKAVPDAAQQVLHGMSADQIERLKDQAQQLTGAELSRAADLTNESLNAMSGATNPQLHLELLCARIMLSPAQTGGAPAAPAAAGASSGRVNVGDPVGSGRAAVQAALNASRQKSAAPEQGRQPSHGRPQQPASKGQGVHQSPAPIHAPSPQQPQSSNGAGPLAGFQSSQQQAQSQARHPQQVQPPRPASQNPAQQGGAQAYAQQGQNVHAGDNVVNMVAHSWNEIIKLVPSPVAQNFFAQCVPSKFENNQLFIRATMPVLRRVKDHIGELEQAIYRVVQLQTKVRGEVDRGEQTQGSSTPAETPRSVPSHAGQNAPQQGQKRPPLATAQQAPQGNQQNTAQRPEIPVAEGPRGGEQAWAAHGQPRSQAEPQWSQDDWNNPVTSWDVVAVPQGDENPAIAPSAPLEAASETAPKSPATDSDQGTAPDATPMHESSTEESSSASAPNGQKYAPQPTVASPAVPEQSEEAAEQTAEQLGESEDEVMEDSHPAAAEPVEPEGKPVADGTTATDTPAQPNENAHNEVQEQPAAGGFPKVPEQQAAHPAAEQPTAEQPSTERPPQQARPIAEEYSDYEGGYFDAPVDEPEYIAGAGYVNNTQPTPVATRQTPVAEHSRPETADADAPAGPLAGGADSLAAGPLGGRSQGADPLASGQVAPQNSDASAPGTGVPSTPDDSPSPSAPAKKLSFRERHAAQFEAGKQAVAQSNEPQPQVEDPAEFVPSDEDTALEETVLMGQKAIEQILGGRVVEETSNFS